MFPPQPSVPEYPHALGSLQLFGTQQPPDTQTPCAHVPQSRLPPQPSGTVPHAAPWLAQVKRLQHLPELQLPPLPQSPQSITPPQPSAAKPQTSGPHAVMGLQQRCAICPPQTSPLAQLPHCSTPPQPSGLVPHSPAAHCSAGEQQRLATLPPQR